MEHHLGQNRKRDATGMPIGYAPVAASAVYGQPPPSCSSSEVVTYTTDQSGAASPHNGSADGESMDSGQTAAIAAFAAMRAMPMAGPPPGAAGGGVIMCQRVPAQAPPMHPAWGMPMPHYAPPPVAAAPVRECGRRSHRRHARAAAIVGAAARRRRAGCGITRLRCARRRRPRLGGPRVRRPRLGGGRRPSRSSRRRPSPLRRCRPSRSLRRCRRQRCPRGAAGGCCTGGEDLGGGGGRGVALQHDQPHNVGRGLVKGRWPTCGGRSIIIIVHNAHIHASQVVEEKCEARRYHRRVSPRAHSLVCVCVCVVMWSGYTVDGRV